MTGSDEMNEMHDDAPDTGDAHDTGEAHDTDEASATGGAPATADGAEVITNDGEVATDEVAPVIELDDAGLERAIEAIVMVATDPVPEALLAELLDVPINRVAARCRALSDQYLEQRRGFELVPIAGGWRYQSHPLQSEFVERFVLEPQSSRMSTAALETLSIIAYKQPISRAQVSAIRGVNVDGVLKTLVTRGYVHEVARDSGPGQAVLYGTTDEFCVRLGISAPSDLPPLGAFVPSAEIVEALELTLRAEPDAPAIDLGPDGDAGNGSEAAEPEADAVAPADS